MTKKLMWIAWPAFLSACALELLVFAVVDPLDLSWSGHPVTWSRQAVYAAAFFVFWLVGLLSGAITMLLGTPAPLVRDCRLSAADRPEGCPDR